MFNNDYILIYFNNDLKVTKNHQVMIDVLETRLMRINAALTFWRKQDFSQLLSYLLRTNDDSIFVDTLPYLTKRYLNELAHMN